MVKMALLHIALHEGFNDDTVMILVNSKEVFNKPNVKTKLQIGYADSIEVNIQEVSVNVKVILPLRNLSESIDLQVSTSVYLGVSASPGRINYRISHNPFGYI